VFAQTLPPPPAGAFNVHTFKYGSDTGSVLVAITNWDGVDNPYPTANGYVKFSGLPFATNDPPENPWCGIAAPFQLGYPNNGFLTSGLDEPWTNRAWSDSTHFTQVGTCTQSGYDAYSQPYTVVVQAINFYLATFKRVCRYGHCYRYEFDSIIDGNGQIWQQ
jgi:hypothetical protein